MWKVTHQFLAMDDKIQRLGILFVSTCNYCANRHEETFDHVISTGNVACMIWKKATYTLRTFNMESEPWRLKVNRWFQGAKISSFFGLLLD